ncbi:MAG: Crp/Fnr family transcriptional regulator [Solirubrobacteraceae bacterium]
MSASISCTPSAQPYPGPRPSRVEPPLPHRALGEPRATITGRATIARRKAVAAIRLLEHLPDLAADLENGQAASAYRALTIPAIELGPGGCETGDWETIPPVTGHPFGMLVVEGLLAREVRLGDRTSTNLYGPGDILDLRTDQGSSLAAGARLMCPEVAVIALLDDRVLIAMREWPRMIARLFAVAMRQLERADINAAIGRLERVEDRLLGFFWLLADRWGRRGPDGIVIEQPLTHEAIGQLIGARRPTVSLGLRALSERRALHRRADGTWLLSPDSLSRLIDVDPPGSPIF